MLGVDKKMVEPMIPIGAAIAFGLGAIGTGIAQSRIGAAGAGVIAEKPELFGLALVFLALTRNFSHFRLRYRSDYAFRSSLTI